MLGLLVLNRFEHENFLIPKYVQYLLPTLPMFCGVAVMLRFVSEVDEMWRKIITENMAFAGLATAFTSLSFVFIGDLGGVIPPEWDFNIFWAYYVIGETWTRWRMR